MSLNLTKNKNLITLIVLSLVIFNLFFLYFIKYTNQNLPFSNFNFSNIGNIFNLSCTLILFTGIVIFSLRSGRSFNSSLLISLTVIMTLVLLIASLLTIINFPFSNRYIFGHPFNEVFVGFVFSFYQFIQFFFIFIIWLNLFGKTDFIYLRSFINSIVLVAALLVFAFVFLHLKRRDNSRIISQKADVAVVLGAAVWSNNKPSPSLASRVDKAAQIYHKGLVNNYSAYRE